MRIAFLVTRADDLGGAQVHVRDLATALKSAGHDVVVLAGANGILAEQLEERDIPFRSLRYLRRPLRPLRDLLGLWEIRRCLRDIQPDIISTHSSKAGILGRIAGYSLGIPTLFTCHGWAFNTDKSTLACNIYRVIERAAAPLAARIITVCQQDRELAIQDGVAGQDHLVTVHNGVVGLNGNQPANPSKSPPLLLMVARFARQKDHRTLFRALSGLLDLEWRLELVGDGPGRRSAADLANGLGLGGRVSFVGFRRDVGQLIERSQAFVLASNWEAFPRSILEAMRGGLPVVATGVGGVGEAVVDGETGFVIRQGDVDNLRDRLRTIIADPILRQQMGAAGRNRYKQKFTLERLARQTFSLYRRVLTEEQSAQVAPVAEYVR